MRSIAKQFRISDSALFRHKDHIALAIQQTQEAREKVSAINVAEQLAELNAETLTILAEAREAVARIERDQADTLPAAEMLPSLEDLKKLSEEEQATVFKRHAAFVKLMGLVGRRRQQEIRNALAAIEAAHAQVKTQATLQGDLAPEGSINIWVHPEWISIRKLLLETLRPFPEARVVVAQALLQLENEAAHGRAG